MRLKWLLYRIVMRLAHRFNWHYAPPVYPEGDTQLWCKWCGLRYTKIESPRSGQTIGPVSQPKAAAQQRCTTLLLLLLPLVAMAQTSVRQNIGGPGYVDASGNTWVADTSTACVSSDTFNRGGAISNTNDPTLYQTGRTDVTAVSCTFPVTNFAFYNVTLRFAETDPLVTHSGQRMFNVFVNGALRYSALDVYRIANGKNIALDLAFGPIPVSTSQIIITLAAVAGYGPTIQAASAVTTGFGTSSSWSDAGSYIFNNNAAGVHLLTTDFTTYGATIQNPGGYTNYTFNQGSTQGTFPFMVFNGVGGSQHGSIDINGGHETYVGAKRKTTITGPLSLLSSDVCLGFSNKDDLGDATEVIDTQVCRGASRQLDIRDELASPTAIKVSKVIVSGTAVEGICDSTQRGRIVFTAGGAGVLDTLRICRKDASDVYAWTALY